jgi:hypothetical protein
MSTKEKITKDGRTKVNRMQRQSSPGIGLLTRYLRLVTATYMIPVSRGRRDGRLSYRPLSAASMRYFLTWFLPMLCIPLSAQIYAWFQPNPQLWAAIQDVLHKSVTATTTDTISYALTIVSFSTIAFFLPGVLAGTLADLQDVVPIQCRITIPHQRTWLPILAASLIVPFDGLQTVYFLVPWWQAVITTAGFPVLPSLGLFAWAFVPCLIFFTNTLIMLLAADLIAVRAMGHLSQRFTSMKEKAAHYYTADETSGEAHHLLVEYRLVNKSLEPTLFLLTSVLTVVLVMSLFYCTDASLEHLMRSLMYLTLLIINGAILYHMCMSADDCYNEFYSILDVLRWVKIRDTPDTDLMEMDLQKMNADTKSAAQHDFFIFFNPDPDLNMEPEF